MADWATVAVGQLLLELLKDKDKVYQAAPIVFPTKRHAESFLNTLLQHQSQHSAVYAEFTHKHKTLVRHHQWFNFLFVDNLLIDLTLFCKVSFLYIAIREVTDLIYVT